MPLSTPFQKGGRKQIWLMKNDQKMSVHMRQRSGDIPASLYLISLYVTASMTDGSVSMARRGHTWSFQAETGRKGILHSFHTWTHTATHPFVLHVRLNTQAVNRTPCEALLRWMFMSGAGFGSEIVVRARLPVFIWKLQIFVLNRCSW